jgi:hypothetical protein
MEKIDGRIKVAPDLKKRGLEWLKKHHSPADKLLLADRLNVSLRSVQMWSRKTEPKIVSKTIRQKIAILEMERNYPDF